ncbi:uncharacterized protein LOC113351176 [Papaver somniferum]|uniref:uncharacterized protein LOC113351176 n=1 Tax=Papaver somniferum TaxID=3469 RepID=UPI000E6FB2AC|nr:uncharacterized protein LOC113351176 [Papaver somniferum]
MCGILKISVLINGSAAGYFKSKKGIRQGDPNSPFLFLLVGEVSNFMIKQHRIKVKNLRLVLLSFELLIGLKINFAKSQIYGVGYDGDLSIFSSILGYYHGSLPTTYLGLPLGDKCGSIAKWDKVIERFTAKLAGWKKPLLSRVGKVTLINSVLSSLPVYYMSLFEMPNSVIQRL